MVLVHKINRSQYELYGILTHISLNDNVFGILLWS